MARLIILQRPATCKSCGATIPAGARARYYRNDQIYCETHQKDADGHDILNAGLLRPPVQKPLDVAPSEPQPMLSVAEADDEMLEEIRLLTQSIHWQTEKIALATDFLNTICILMRQNQEVRNDKAKQDNGPQPQAPARTAKKPGK